MKFPYFVEYKKGSVFVWIVNKSAAEHSERFDGLSQIIMRVKCDANFWKNYESIHEWCYGYSEDGQLLMWREWENYKLKQIF